VTTAVARKPRSFHNSSQQCWPLVTTFHTSIALDDARVQCSDGRNLTEVFSCCESLNDEMSAEMTPATSFLGCGVDSEDGLLQEVVGRAYERPNRRKMKC